MLSVFGNILLLSTEQLERRWKGVELCIWSNSINRIKQNWQVIWKYILWRHSPSSLRSVFFHRYCVRSTVLMEAHCKKSSLFLFVNLVWKDSSKSFKFFKISNPLLGEQVCPCPSVHPHPTKQESSPLSRNNLFLNLVTCTCVYKTEG